jgi:hypothetical protein
VPKKRAERSSGLLSVCEKSREEQKTLFIARLSKQVVVLGGWAERKT